jgi:hypothetical protein
MRYKTDIEAATIIDIAINKNNVLDKLIKYFSFNNR